MRADARRNRERVLEAARLAFATDGLAVPLDDIARRAGVGPGTVYRHFATKDALFEAVLVDLLESLVHRAVELEATGPPEQAFFTYFGELIEAGAENKALFDAISGSAIELQAKCAQTSEELNAALARLLRAAQHAGAARRDIKVTDLKPLLIGALAAQGATDGHSASKRLVEISCDGLRPSPTDSGSRARRR
jgi:AcrR family transcriptional regulator